MTIQIYHNPRCSKSRQALLILEKNGLKPTIIDYLKTPPDFDTIKGLLTMLKLKPGELVRKQESTYKALIVKNGSLNNDELIKAMVENPILIQRPIVTNRGQAIIGRPPEKVLSII